MTGYDDDGANSQDLVSKEAPKEPQKRKVGRPKGYPKSGGGKPFGNQNGVTHGLYSKAPKLNALDRAKYNNLFKDLANELKGSDQNELTASERLVLGNVCLFQVRLTSLLECDVPTIPFDKAATLQRAIMDGLREFLATRASRRQDAPTVAPTLADLMERVMNQAKARGVILPDAQTKKESEIPNE